MWEFIGENKVNITIKRQQIYMSLTRKCLDRKHLISKLEQAKYDTNGDIIKCNLATTIKRQASTRPRKSKQKTVKTNNPVAVNPRDRSSRKSYKHGKQALDRSKQSKQSRDSLLKSTHSYYITQTRKKRSSSAASKHLKSQKSKELTNNSNCINSTFEMKSFITSHQKKKSNFSSTIGTKFDMALFNKSAINNWSHGEAMNNSGMLGQLLIKSQTVLERYKEKYETLQRENKRYKKRYQQAMKKIKRFESKD